ncbi:hypothetical protein BPOR_0747g00010 [Botrytis porri]|uniref:Uncharacterized protein n=1 Tax=Botrytis porri TaxID=87229 RepID=A0A4Z1KA07_9HELO|nr:hypothetical protein BPOR_0747g00010 [Botrytis porri]
MAQKGQQIDLTSLTTAQLSQVKKQLDDELEHLTSSFQQLRAAQSKFRECLRSISTGVGKTVEEKRKREGWKGKSWKEESEAINGSCKDWAWRKEVLEGEHKRLRA